MKPIAKLYLKTFLLTGILFGLIMLGFDLTDGDGSRIWKLLLMAFFFGTIMSLILVSFHRYRLKKNGVQEFTDDNVGVHQKRNLRTRLNKEEIIQRLKADPVIGKMKMTEIESGIVLKAGMSWKSWGEEIKITLKANEATDLEYQVSSSPRLKTTIVDYGKNIENINRIESLIKTIAY